MNLEKEIIKTFSMADIAVKNINIVYYDLDNFGNYELLLDFWNNMYKIISDKGKIYMEIYNPFLNIFEFCENYYTDLNFLYSKNNWNLIDILNTIKNGANIIGIYPDFRRDLLCDSPRHHRK